MANTQETITGIIAWLRRPREGENAYLTAWRDEIADRLEAAWKREKAAIEADALEVGGIVGASPSRRSRKEGPMSRSNNGKPFYVDVGTSIVAVRCASNHDVILEYDHSRHPFVITLAEKACDRMNREAEIHNSGDCAKLREALENLYDQICHGETEQHVAANRQMIRAALAAPPRNCDRFATADEAFHAWNNTVDTPGGGTYVGLMDWLYAPATEQEGGKDAD